MDCPRCHTALDKATHQGARVLHCTKCHGCAVTIELLRRLAAKPRVDAIWLQACDPVRRGDLKCPECHQRLTRATTPHGGAQVALDICHHCHVVWFDAGELESVEAQRIKPMIGAEPAGHTGVGSGEGVSAPTDELWRLLGSLTNLVK